MSVWIHRAIVVFIAVFLTACGEEKTAESVFPRTSPSCEPLSLPGRYVVYWEDGRVSLEKAQSRQNLIDRLVKPRLHEIRRVEPDQWIQVTQREKLRNSSGQSDELSLQWGAGAAEAQWAWRMGLRGQGSVVAVIDSQVDIDHPQLSGRIKTNPGEEGLDDQGRDKRSNQIDDDGNGYVDDWAGYGFFSYAPNRSLQPDIHGTHVAGIIVAQHKDEEIQDLDYVQGIAPEAQILPLAFIGALGGGTLYDAIRAIDYAVAHGAHVINASWGGAACSPELGQKIKGLKDHNVLFVAAAGNRGLNIDRFLEYPASFNLGSQITVGSIGRSGLMADHSNFGDQNVHIFAPGVDILSTVPFGGVESLTGTSMATPFVSGALALLKGHRPQAQMTELRDVLLQSAEQRSLYRNASRGRLNIARALIELERLYPE